MKIKKSKSLYLNKQNQNKFNLTDTRVLGDNVVKRDIDLNLLPGKAQSSRTKPRCP